MDNIHKEALRKTRPLFVQDLDPSSEIQDLLVSESIFTPQMLEPIQAGQTRQDKVRQLLNDLERRGPKAFDTFLKCLKKSGHEHLANALEEKERELRGPPAPVRPEFQQEHEKNPKLAAMIEKYPKLAAMIETTKYTMEKEKETYEFIPTQSLHDAHEKLLENNIVIIQGNTGDGKSSTAIELLRLLCRNEEGQQKRCRQPLQLHDIKDLDLVAPKSQLVIYLDDIFGKNVVCQDDVREWEKREKSVISKLYGTDTGANYLVITIRTGILNSLNSLEYIFTEQNIVDLSKYTDDNGKLKLLRLYKPKGEFDNWTDDEEREIIRSAPDIGFPQCCRLFRDTPTLQTGRVNFFRKPFHYLKSSLSKLENWKFGGLLYLFLNGGKVMENDLDPSNENIDESKEIKAAYAFDIVRVNPTRELVYNKGRKAELVKESLECLLGWLVKKESIQKQGKRCPCYKFNHDSIEETVALLYGEKTPIGYIQNCPKKFLSHITKKETIPNTIVIASTTETNALYERIVQEFKSVDPISDWYLSEWEYLVTLDVWTDPQFRQGFIKWLSGQNAYKKLSPMIKHALLNGACSTGSEALVSYLISVGITPDEVTPFCVVKGGSVRLLSVLLSYVVTPSARALMSRSPHYTREYYIYNINVLHEACLFERGEMVTMLCDTFSHLAHGIDGQGRSTLHLVARTGNVAVFQTVEKTILKSLCRVEDAAHKCEVVDGRVLHRHCVCGQYMSQLVDNLGRTVLHVSCKRGHVELSLMLCELYPALTTVVDNDGLTVLHWSCMCEHRELSLELCKLSPALTIAVDNDGYHCLHHIARRTSAVDMFTECERHVKQYIETTGGKYDITTILTKDGKSVLDLAKEWTEYRTLDANPLYDHLVKLFSK